MSWPVLRWQWLGRLVLRWTLNSSLSFWPLKTDRRGIGPSCKLDGTCHYDIPVPALWNCPKEFVFFFFLDHLRLMFVLSGTTVVKMVVIAAVEFVILIAIMSRTRASLVVDHAIMPQSSSASLRVSASVCVVGTFLITRSSRTTMLSLSPMLQSITWR